MFTISWLLLSRSLRFARTRGYMFGLEFDGDCEDQSPRGADGSVVTTVVAIDASRCVCVCVCVCVKEREKTKERERERENDSL